MINQEKKSTENKNLSTEEARFTHLHVHSHYSLLDGLSKIGELLDYVKELGMDSIAVTDHGNLYGAIEFYQEAKKRGIKPIIGLEGYIAIGDMRNKQPNIDDKRYHITLLAKNNQGYKNLIALSTKAHLEGFYYKPRFDKPLLKKYSKGIIALSGCLGAEIPSLILKGKMERAKKAVLEYQDIFGKENFYIELQDHPNLADQIRVNKTLIKLAKAMIMPIVATQDSHYLRREDAEAHDILLAVQTGNKIDDENRLTFKGDDFSLKSPKEMIKAFSDYPEAIENTQKIANECDVEIELGKIQLPSFDVPKAFKSDEEYLTKLCIDGLKKRYDWDISKITNYKLPIIQQIPQPSSFDKPEARADKANSNDQKQKEIAQRLDYELSVIKNTGFASYMLIVQDLVNWAKNSGIIVGPGRGSAAGSIVSYLLNITNIDPIEFNLIFERFLNPERISMPDIDLDFTDTRRDEVIQYVSQKYGTDKVAQIITFGTMAARAAVRDVGRALGYTYDYCDKIAKIIPMFYTLQKSLKEVTELTQIYASDPQAKKLLDSAKKLEGVARHASVHACGVVITRKPLIDMVPLQNSTQNTGHVITQYEMHAVENLGLLKMDFLGLKNLTIIEHTLEAIKKRHNKILDIEKIPLDDKKTFELLQNADTTGVFQLEGDGMRRYLKELKPTNIEDIIAMVALYRPGPMDLIPNFISRKHGRERVDYLHPKLEPILKNTYGVGVYQEQMMKIATDLAGYSLPEADTLRKAIGKKIKKLLDEQQEKLISGMIKNGIDAEIAKAIWDLFPPFARYGFPRAHAACYARIAYETAYLKAHYPTEFAAALLNAEVKNIDRLSFLIQEFSKMNIELLPPSINESEENFTVVKPGIIRFGLTAIKNVGSNVAHEIIKERNNGEKYKSIEGLLQRILTGDINKKSLESLIKAGALDELSERNLLLENMDNLLRYSKKHKEKQNSSQFSLFSDELIRTTYTLPLASTAPATDKQKLVWEKELLGFYVSSHPLKEHAKKLKGFTEIKTITTRSLSSIKIGAIINNTKKIVTKNGQPMMFASLEDLSGKIEAIIFPSLFEKKQAILEENRLVIVEGKINTRDGDIKLICDNITELT